VWSASISRTERHTTLDTTSLYDATSDGARDLVYDTTGFNQHFTVYLVPLIATASLVRGWQSGRTRLAATADHELGNSLVGVARRPPGRWVRPHGFSPLCSSGSPDVVLVSAFTHGEDLGWCSDDSPCGPLKG
jgi:hypothetical protein